MRVYAWMQGIVVVAILSVQPMIALAGFGVSPPTIREENAVPGAEFTRTIYLVQGNPTVPVTINATIESEDMRSWVTIADGSTFTIPAGVQQYPLAVTVRVPADTAFGVYRGFLRVSTVPEARTEDGQVAIALGGRVDMTVTVGDNVVEEYEVTQLSILDIPPKIDPLVEATVANTGNVPAAPDSASFELFDKFGEIRLGFAQVDFAATPTPPFSENTYYLSFPLDLVIAEGEYWGHVKLYTERGEQIKELRTVFNVTSAAQLPSGFMAGSAASSTRTSLVVGIATALLLCIVGFVAIRRLR